MGEQPQGRVEGPLPPAGELFRTGGALAVGERPQGPGRALQQGGALQGVEWPLQSSHVRAADHALWGGGGSTAASFCQDGVPSMCRPRAQLGSQAADCWP